MLMKHNEKMEEVMAQKKKVIATLVAQKQLEKGKAELASQRTKEDNEFSKAEKQIKSAKY